MKRKSTIYGIQSSRGYERTRTHERWLKNMAARVEDLLSVAKPPRCAYLVQVTGLVVNQALAAAK